MRRFAAMCLSLGLLLAISSKAYTTSSLAWSKLFDHIGPVGQAIQCTDASGNVLFGLCSSMLTVTKYDQYGNQLWSNSSYATGSFILYGLAADQYDNTYAVLMPTSASFNTMVLKFGSDGKFLWSLPVSDGADSAMVLTPLAIAADAQGVSVACAGFDSVYNTRELYGASLDPNGMPTGLTRDTSISIGTAKFCPGGNLLVTGVDPSSPSTGLCRVYSSNGSTVLNYSISGTCVADHDSSGNVYLAGNLGGLYRFYTISKYDRQGVSLWATNATYGQVRALSAGNPNQVFLYFDPGQLELLDPDIVPFPQSGPPTPVFSNAVTIYTMVSDPAGGIVTVGDGGGGSTIRRYDLNGALTWAQTFLVANEHTLVANLSVAATPAQTGPSPVVFAGGDSKLVLQGMSEAAPLFLAKYVANTAVVGLTLSPTYVTGGSPVVGTIKLDAPADIGGATINLSTSAQAVAKPPLTLTIPQGGSTGTFAATTTPVNVKTAVTLSATFGGAKRSAVVNVMPATLFSVKTAVATVKGGTYVTGTVTLTGKAGSAGRSVALSSSFPTAASVPPGETVAPGASSVNFVVATKHVLTNEAVTITARSGTTTKTTTLTVTP